MSPQQSGWTPRDRECAQAVLARTGPADGALPTLTDEEIVALDGVDRAQLVPLPFLDRNGGDKRLMATVALRGLLAKQIAYPRVSEGQPPAGLAAVPEVTGILTLRRTGRRIVSGERRSAAGTHWIFGYVHGDRVLEEQISDAGVHAFEVYPVAQLVERLGALADPQGAAAGDGVPDVLAQVRFEQDAPALLAVTTVVAGGVEPDSRAVLTVYALADRVRTLDAVTGDAGISYTVAEVSPATLRRRLAEDLVRL